MKIILTSLFAFTSVVSSAFAQFSSLPPSSTLDGITIKSIGVNAGSTHWESGSSIGAYASSSDGYSDPVSANSPDSHLGLAWQQGAPLAVGNARSALDRTGGVLRVIVLGETAEWLNDFGYTYSGKPVGAQSYTVLQNIQSVGPNANLHFGDYIDLSLSAGEAGKFDLWYNSIGENGLDTPSTKTGRGGIYTAFTPSNGDPSSTANQFLWASNSLKVSTWIPSLNTYMGVDTYMLGIEDWRLATGSDRDYSDLRIALQFFDANGVPLAAAIPEPAHFALLLGGLIAAGMALLRLRTGLAPAAA